MKGINGMDRIAEKYAIVAIGYNRPECMLRLLNSLARAEYDQSIPLIISLDNCGNNSVKNIADEFIWCHGEKRIIFHNERLGLKKHILSCGELLKEFEAIAVFEDDLIVSPGFFQFMKEAVPKYYNDDRIAGISLYKYEWNEHAGYPFEPARSQYDAFFIKTSQSWGQIWMKPQWSNFIEWLHKNPNLCLNDKLFPSDVLNWPNSSWKKHHISYCAHMDKYFVFPYNSLTTCCSDVGEHCKYKVDVLQVPVLEGVKKKYSLPDLTSIDAVKYDTFFEREMPVKEIMGISVEDICIDLYGIKDVSEQRIVLTTRKFDNFIISSYGLEMRPHEENILHAVLGKHIFLYDMHKKENNVFDSKLHLFGYQFFYRFKVFGRNKDMFKSILSNILGRINKKTKR